MQYHLNGETYTDKGWLAARIMEIVELPCDIGYRKAYYEALEIKIDSLVPGNKVEISTVGLLIVSNLGDPEPPVMNRDPN